MTGIKLKKIRKNYDKFSIDIDDLAIPRGCIVGVIGKNGSGKTTLLNVISGIDKPASGSIKIDGVEITNLNDDRTCIYL